MRDRRDVPPRYLDGVSRYHPHRYQTPPTSQHTDIAIPPPPISRYRDATPYHPHRYRDAIPYHPHRYRDIAMPFHTTPTNIAIPPPPILRYHHTTIPPGLHGLHDLCVATRQPALPATVWLWLGCEAVGSPLLQIKKASPNLSSDDRLC